eukprot:827397_1
MTSYDDTPMAKWTNEHWCQFIKHKKVGSQKQRVFPKKEAKKIIDEIRKEGGISGAEFCNMEPQQMKARFKLNGIDCNRFKQAKHTHKAKQQEKKEEDKAPDTTNAWPTTGALTIYVALDNGKTDTITAQHDWTVADLLREIKSNVASLRSGFDIIIGSKRFTNSEGSTKLKDTGMNIQNPSCRPVQKVFSKPQAKKQKKKKKYCITIKYCTNVAVFDRLNKKNESSMDVIQEEDTEEEEEEEEETLSLIFENQDKKQCWLELIQNLVNEERAKYRKKNKKTLHFEPQKKTRPNRNHFRSRSLNAVKKSCKKQQQKEKVASFCGICHSSFNPLYNMPFECCRCALTICDACCCDHFYLNNKFKVPHYIKLCVRCNYDQHNERSCDILCV